MASSFELSNSCSFVDTLTDVGEGPPKKLILPKHDLKTNKNKKTIDKEVPHRHNVMYTNIRNCYVAMLKLTGDNSVHMSCPKKPFFVSRWKSCYGRRTTCSVREDKVCPRSLSKLSDKACNQTGTHFHCYAEAEFAGFAEAAAIIMSLFPHSMYVERLVSSHNLIKSETRASIDRETLNDYRTVKESVGPLAAFDARRTIAKWMSLKQRRPKMDDSQQKVQKYMSHEYVKNVFSP